MEWVHESTADNSSRFVLGTVGVRPLVCVGLNPSTALPNDLDRTLARVQAVATLNGYDSFLMLNVYPLRSTDPGKLPMTVDPQLLESNGLAVAKALSGTDPDVWAAWGALITKRKFLAPALLELLKLPELGTAKWFSRGRISNDGHPHHPLFVKDVDPLVPFDIKSYGDKFRA
ncbi:DUF1643 domain-containing protein [soil metagenome]